MKTISCRGSVLKVDLYNNTYNTSFVIGDEYLQILLPMLTMLVRIDSASIYTFYNLNGSERIAISLLVFVVSLCQIITGPIPLKAGLLHLFSQITLLQYYKLQTGSTNILKSVFRKSRNNCNQEVEQKKYVIEEGELDSLSVA